MRAAILAICLSIGLGAAAFAADQIPNYKGPFPTTALYTMCSRSDSVSRGKCQMYIQGLIYGLRISQSMAGKLKICLPEMSTEAARIRILQFINGTTGGRPETNGDGGDWMAFMGLIAGNSGAACQ